MANAALPPPGFDKFHVPEMPGYVHGYAKRGNQFDSDVTPVYQQTRFGNPRYQGGMDAYLSMTEDGAFFEPLRQKKGNHGVFDGTRWSAGYDWRGGFGIASLDQQKNVSLHTRGGELRQGGPRRSDYTEQAGEWHRVVRPGISHSRFTQKNDNYSGVYHTRRRTPFITLENDALVLREMIEKNPFHIASHAAMQAKAVYDKEFEPAALDRAVPAYDDGIPASEKRAMAQAAAVAVQDDDPFLARAFWDSN